MPSALLTIDIRASPEDVFDLVHDYSRRLEWDPFLREARLLDSATIADLGVSSRCVSRWGVGGMAMDTVYVSFSRPNIAAVKMTSGPWFLGSFAASIRHDRVDDDSARVSYRYNFKVRSRLLALLVEPIVQFVFYRETSRRLAALKLYLERGR